MAKKRKEQMDDSELLAIIDSRKFSGINFRDDELSLRRTELFKGYMGSPRGDERPGQSKIVTRGMLEAVEWTLPSLLRVFMASPLVVEFDPDGPEDEDAAKQETEALNHIFWKKNDGFMTLYTWIKDTLMNPVGYVKVYRTEEEKVTTEKYKGLTVQEVQQLLDDDTVEITEQEESMIEIQAPAGPVLMPMYEIALKRTTTGGGIAIAPVPPEELTIDDKLASTSLESADFICHTTKKTRSDLIEMGFDYDTVYSLPAFSEEYSEAESRRSAGSGRSYQTSVGSNDESTELIELDETYLRIDYDGDGIAEFREILSCADVVLENEEADSHPFIAMSSVPLPHLHVGLSWMELVEDIQKIYTTITRQLLNNMYQTNNPRTVVGKGVNLSDVLNKTGSGIIRANNIDQMRTEPTAPVIGQVLPAFEMLDQMGERRTGVSKSTMGLDTDALSRVAKGAYLGSLEQANQRLEALARIIAECGVKPLFLKIHKLMLTNQESSFQAKISGEWQSVNPGEWRERKNMTCTVGLGTGNKQAQMMALEKVQETQASFMQMGKETLIDDQNLYNTSEKLIEIAGLHNAERYFKNPSKQPPQQPQPPPPDANMELVKVEAKKAEMQNQQKQAEMQMKMRESQMKMQGEIQKLQLQLQKQQQDARLKNRDLDLKEGKILLDSELEQTRMDQDNLRDLEEAQDKFKGDME